VTDGSEGHRLTDLSRKAARVIKHALQKLERWAIFVKSVSNAFGKGVREIQLAGDGGTTVGKPPLSNERGTHPMNLKRFCALMVALVAIGAVVASSASATVSTTAAKWYTGAAEGTVTELTGSQAVTAELLEGEKAVLNTIIGGKSVELTAGKISCVECSIENKEVTSKTGKVAYGSGKIKFTEVTVMSPVGCTVSGEGGVTGEIVTKPLVIHGDWMDTNTANLHAFIQFIPAAGATTTFAQFKLSTTGECEAIGGNFNNVTGTVFGESKNNTGVASKNQDLILSSAVQTTTGASLKVGANAATFASTARFKTPVANKEFFAIK
jgi:hypothetical protein